MAREDAQLGSATGASPFRAVRRVQGEREHGEREHGEREHGELDHNKLQHDELEHGEREHGERVELKAVGRLELASGPLRRARAATERARGYCRERMESAVFVPAQALATRSIHGALRVGRRVAKGVFADLLDALYPQRCALCPAAGSDGPWCSEHRLPDAPEGERCERCAARLPAALAGERRCAACRRRSPGIARALVLADYRTQPIRPWILAFKHGGRSDLAVPLAAALAAHVARTLPWPDDGVARLLCPIPLHPWRRLERGYDQALLLAQALGAELEAPCEELLRRSRATAVQGAAGARSRASNVRGAFALRSSGWRSKVLGRRATRIREELARFDEIWLVDDVVTSGATLREAARALRRSGARRVCALALARADGAAHDLTQDADDIPLGLLHGADL